MKKAMTDTSLTTGHVVYDPSGTVEAEPKPIAPRIASLKGVRLGVLDNTKWNARKLLESTVTQVELEGPLAQVRYYKKESFSKNASPDLIGQIARENDAVLTAVGD